MSTFSVRHIDANTCLIVDETGAQIAITDTTHAAVLVASADLLEAAQHLLNGYFYRHYGKVHEDDIERLRVATVRGQTPYNAERWEVEPQLPLSDADFGAA